MIPRPLLTALLAAPILMLAAPVCAKTLKAEEARKTFFGIDMEGVLEGVGAHWRECIEPKGETSYWYEGAFDRGRLRIRDDGALCFSYASRGYAGEGCYTAERAGKTWRFTDVDDPSVVFVAKTSRKVRACPTEDVPVS